MSLSVVFACNKEQDKKDEEGAEASSSSYRPRTSVTEVVEEKDGYILDNAQTSYKLVVDKNASLPIRIAIEEFNNFFKKATKRELTVVYDDEVSFSEGAKYISFGDNAFSAQAGVKGSDLNVTTDGFRIKTKGNSVFVVGKGDYGVLYGAYQLLNYLIGYECYGVDLNDYEENVSSIRLYDFDVTSSPSFEIRPAGYGCLDASKETLNRLRLLNTSNTLRINGATGHTSLSYVEPEIFLDEENHPDTYHPKWYYLEGTTPMQLCYTAHGDEAELEAMIEECANSVKKALKEQPNGLLANMSLQDNTSWCNCEKCKSESQKYSSDAAVVVKFLNRLSRKVYAWFDTEEGRPYKRDLKFVFYAYLALEAPPAKYDDATGTWKVIDNEVLCDKTVVPQVCITVGNYTQPVTTAERNKLARKQIEGWSTLCENIFSYMYSANYRNFMLPLDTFNAMQDWYRYYYDKGCIKMYDLGQGDEYGCPTGWSNLKMYLNAKLSWNVDADVEKLTDNFFNAVYKDGAKYVRKVYDEYRVLSQYNADNVKGYLSSVISAGPYILKKDYWPKNKLMDWQADLDNAMKAIEHLKTEDAEKYQITARMISSERVWVNYILYNVYRKEFDQASLTALKTDLYNDLVACKITKEREHGSIDQLLSELKG